jgi:hypothetical protein
MAESVATFFVHLLYIYAALGVLFALTFVFLGVQKVDRQAAGTGVMFRLLILPGSAALWPLLLKRWIHATGEPPEERNSNQ